MFPVPTLNPSPPGFQPLLASHCPHLPLAGHGGRPRVPRETHYSQIRTLLGRDVSVPTEPATPPPLPLLPQVPHGKSPTVTAMDRKLSPDLSRGWKGRCPYCLPQGMHRKGTKTVGLECPWPPLSMVAVGMAENSGRQPSLCTQRLAAPQASAFHSRVRLISGELDPGGGFRGPLCPYLPSSPAPTPSRTPGVLLSMGPAQHCARGRGAEAWVLPLVIRQAELWRVLPGPLQTPACSPVCIRFGGLCLVSGGECAEGV